MCLDLDKYILTYTDVSDCLAYLDSWHLLYKVISYEEKQLWKKGIICINFYQRS